MAVKYSNQPVVFDFGFMYPCFPLFCPGWVPRFVVLPLNYIQKGHSTSLTVEKSDVFTLHMMNKDIEPWILNPLTVAVKGIQVGGSAPHVYWTVQ